MDPVPLGQESVSLVNALKDFRTETLIVLAVAVLAIFTLRVVERLLSAREARKAKLSAEADKNSLQNILRELTSRVGSSSEALRAVRAELADHTEHEEQVMETLFSAINQSHKEVSQLLAVTKGQLSLSDSLLVIKDTFQYKVYLNLLDVFSASFVENHYTARSKAVRSKIKTKIARVLEEAQRDLNNRNLSCPTGPFFPSYDDPSGGLRYTLCNDVWDAVEPMYRLKDGLPPPTTPEEMRLREVEIREKQLEEVKIILQNLLMDHYVRTVKADDLDRPTTEDIGRYAGVGKSSSTNLPPVKVKT